METVNFTYSVTKHDFDNLYLFGVSKGEEQLHYRFIPKEYFDSKTPEEQLELQKNIVLGVSIFEPIQIQFGVKNFSPQRPMEFLMLTEKSAAEAYASGGALSSFNEKGSPMLYVHNNYQNVKEFIDRYPNGEWKWILVDINNHFFSPPEGMEQHAQNSKYNLTQEIKNV